MLFKLRSGIPPLADNITLSPLLRREATDRWATALVKEMYQVSSSSACSTDSAEKLRGPAHHQVSSDTVDIFPTVSTDAISRRGYFRLPTPSFSRKCSSYAESDANSKVQHRHQQLNELISNDIIRSEPLSPRTVIHRDTSFHDGLCRSVVQREVRNGSEVYISSPSVRPHQFKIDWSKPPTAQAVPNKTRRSCCF